jgi:hypothetical protein
MTIEGGWDLPQIRIPARPLPNVGPKVAASTGEAGWPLTQLRSTATKRHFIAIEPEKMPAGNEAGQVTERANSFD